MLSFGFGLCALHRTRVKLLLPTQFKNLNFLHLILESRLLEMSNYKAMNVPSSNNLQFGLIQLDINLLIQLVQYIGAVVHPKTRVVKSFHNFDGT